MNKLKSQRGQALVEFALILPLLLLLVFGIIQFGFIFHAYLTVNEAAREGARLAAVKAYAEDSAIKAKVQERTPSLTLTIDITPAGTRPIGSTVSVTVSADIQAFKMPLVGDLLPESLTSLEGNVKMRVENDTPTP